MDIRVRVFKFRRGSDPEKLRLGFRSRNPGAIVQAVRTGAASNAFFLEMLAAQTLRAMVSGSLVAKKAEIDFLLRLAGDSQITRAMARVGVQDGEDFLLVVASRGRIAVPPGHGGRELPSSTLSEDELDGIEKAALLNARRS